ncbi:MAG: type 1 glutamine amidotransferase [Anaerolineae bacterium]|nr:type 1 glutamine amidotransferase [Anaerolineae bacterium]
MKLKGKKIAVLVGPGFEELEFWVPLMRMQEEGAQTTVIGLKAGETYPGKSGGLTATADVGASEISADQFDAIIVPGGWAPDKIRRYEAVKALVRDTYKQGKIVGAICHGGQVLISAGIVKGHRATGSEGIADDLINAGATWIEDKAAFRSGNIVWGRVVPDIPDFCRELVEAISAG